MSTQKNWVGKKSFFNFPETLDSERGGIDMHMSAGFKTLELSSAEIWRSHLQPIPLYKIGGWWTVEFWDHTWSYTLRGAC